MIDNIKDLCKQHLQVLQSAHLITIHETFSNHSDYLTVSFMLDALLKGTDVTFLALRQNYAHYLALSKKMGKSIEQFGKNGKLNDLCSQLPLTESSPSVYVRPPKFVIAQSLNNASKIQIKQGSLFIVDALCFIQHVPQTCYKLYEEGLNKQCKIIFGGCSMNGSPSTVLCKQADLWIKLENDVGGHSKFRICQQNLQTSVLCKWAQGGFQVSKYMKV